MVYLLNMVIFHGYVSHNQMVCVFLGGENSFGETHPNQSIEHLPFISHIREDHGAVVDLANQNWAIKMG